MATLYTYQLSCTSGREWSMVGEDVSASLRKRVSWNELGAFLVSLIKKEGENEPGLRWLRKVVVLSLESLAVSRVFPDNNPWEDKDWEAELSGMPPMEGGEYVDASLMNRTMECLWRYLQKEVTSFSGGWNAWLDSLGETWSLIGKVVFHLAEIPSGGERPFGFLATYADKLSQEGKPQHVPLSRAIARAKEDKKAMEALLAPLRKAAEQSDWLRKSMTSGKLFRAESMSVEEAYGFLRVVPCLKDAGLVTRMPAEWSKDGPSRVIVQVSLGEQQEGADSVGGRPLWDFRADLALDGEPLTDEEWEKIRTSQSGLIFLRGKWVEVNTGHVTALLKAWRQVKYLHGQGLPLAAVMKLIAGKVPEVVSSVTSEGEGGEWDKIEAGKAVEACLQELRNPPELPEDPSLQAELREYQKQGVSWLRSLYRIGMGACLADDMGLGKTLQVIAFLSQLKRESSGEAGIPSLIVAPASLLSNWEAEIRKFAPHLQYYVFHGEKTLSNIEHKDVVITTYSFLHLREFALSRPWDVVIIDEAQNVKNASTKQSVAASKLHANMKIALTGTPIENGIGDLWSIFHIINPGLLGGSLGTFLREFEKNKTEASYATLRKIITPFILRRMKSDPEVALNLPPKTELIQRCFLTRKQAILYAHLTESLRKELFSKETNEEGEKKGVGSPVLKYILKFKQLCDHPSLLNGDNIFHPDDGGKWMRLGELAREWASRQEKVLVFTQFREMCAPLVRFLEEIYGEPGLVMHGETPLAQRRAGVEAFQRSNGPPFYVLSVKIAGTGLTLTEASHVVHFDRWWNPAVENQASDRAYRLGQTKPIFVHKFLVLGTMEEKIDRLISRKQQKADDVLQWEDSWEKTIANMTPQDFLDLI